MKFYLLLVLFWGLATASPKIIGGNNTDISRVPYILALERDEFGKWYLECGGIIVGPKQVVTSAHCVMVENLEEIRFRSGSNSSSAGEIHQVAKITIHPNYTLEDTAIFNDVAVCEVLEPFNYSVTVQPIALIDSEPEVGTIALLVGYGDVEADGTPSKHLQSGVVAITDGAECKSAYAEVGLHMEETALCAGVPDGQIDICFGDSGGPLVVDGKLAGIISWGMWCGLAGYPSVNSNVAHFRNWILDQINS